MGEPLFYLQIVDRNGVVVHIPGGGTLETDLIDLLARTIIAKGVGVFRTSAHVEQDIKDGVRDALMSLKDQTRFIA